MFCKFEKNVSNILNYNNLIKLQLGFPEGRLNEKENQIVLLSRKLGNKKTQIANLLVIKSEKVINDSLKNEVLSLKTK